MTRTAWVWTVLIGAYSLFFGWYTSFGCPLSEAEVEHYMSLIEAGGSRTQEERVLLRRFMETDTGDDFVMINAIDMYETPLQVEGVAPGESSQAVLGKYMAYMYPALFSRASHPVLFGSAASQALDIVNAEGMESWTTGAGMRYRSRRDMLEIATNPAFAGSHVFKTAALRKTIAFPLDPWFQLGDPRLVLALLLGFLGSGISWLMAARRLS